MEPICWGVLSTAKIGLEKVLPAMAESPDCEIVAIASRDLAKANAAADELGIARRYGSYQEIFGSCTNSSAKRKSAMACRVIDEITLAKRSTPWPNGTLTRRSFH